MTLEVETVVAVSLMMAVFAAVAAVGTSIVLGAGFERLRAGFEVVRKQTGFFSDAIYKLERKVDEVDKQAAQFGTHMQTLEARVVGVGEQADAFTNSMQTLERKVDIVDKQTAFFSDAIHKLEQKVDQVDGYEEVLQEKMERHADTDLISTARTEAMIAQAEDLLTQVSALNTAMMGQMQPEERAAAPEPGPSLSVPKDLVRHVLSLGDKDRILLN